jgi:hypothetical protein
MTALPARNILDGTKTPATTTADMKTALGSIRDFLSDTLGADSAVSFVANIAARGYQKFPNGFTLQWDSVVLTAAAGSNIVFPVSFTSGLFGVVMTPSDSGTVTNYRISATNQGVAGFTGVNTAAFNVGVTYFAFGK